MLSFSSCVSTNVKWETETIFSWIGSPVKYASNVNVIEEVWHESYEGTISVVKTNQVHFWICRSILWNILKNE